MQSLLRAQCRRLHCIRQSRGLATGSPANASKYPVQVGSTRFQEGDRVIATNKDGKRYKSRLIDPLKAGGSTRTGSHSYQINHSDIIGQPVGRVHVYAEGSNRKSQTTFFRVTHPSLEQFISLAPRSVTPIYSSYGATIVNLLDIHAAPSSPNNGPTTPDISRFEILEAGTGNGGLTLHLARAIAAANPPPPYFESEPTQEELATAWTTWQAQRRSVVHTVEFQAARSHAAEDLIKSFRGAMYWPHINFHSGDVGAWVRNEQAQRNLTTGSVHPFLDIVILDLPAVDQQIQHIADAMKDSAQLLVWVPQITQVVACQHEIHRLGLPLNLDQVVELGEGISSGRRWDVRFAKLRSELKREREASRPDSVGDPSDSTGSSIEAENLDVDISEDAVAETIPSASGATFPTMVCRPMVGELTMGGGFVGLWRRKARPMKLNIVK